MTTERTDAQLSMARHPDIMALRERYEQASEAPFSWLVEGLTFMGGAYAAISPWVVDFNGQAHNLAASNLIVGIAIALLAFAFGANYARTHGLAWITPLLGVWLIITPWVIQNIDRTTGLMASNVATGACVTVLGLAITAITMRRRRF